MKIVFFGSPPFAAKTLEFLLSQGIDICAVVTQAPKPVGRSSTPVQTAVAHVATANNLPLYEPLKATDPVFIASLAAYNADLFVVVAYGKILRPQVLNMAKHGCINVHASLLPLYRGAAPIQRALIDGQTETGVTIMKLVEEMDAGDMLATALVPIGPDVDLATLEDQLCQAAQKPLIETIDALDKGTANATVQDHERATFAPKVEVAEVELDFNRDAVELHNLIRGVCGRPTAWCTVKVKDNPVRVKVYRSAVVPQSDEPGTLLDDKRLIVACGFQALELLEVQPASKKRMTGSDFLRGSHPDFTP